MKPKTLIHTLTPVAATALLTLLLGCVDESRSRRATMDSSAPKTPGATAVVVGPCEAGVVRDCTITLSQHNGVLNCYHGEQVCIEGAWSDCGSGEIRSLPVPGSPKATRGGITLKAITGAEACDTNPCDPSCMELEREPDAGAGTAIPVDNVDTFDWVAGRFEDLPGGLVSKGRVEPCATAADCQLNAYCDQPLSGSCAHSKCAEGSALEEGCDPCVDQVCAVDPSCCLTDVGDMPVCAHDPCEEGVALQATCDACVNAICTVQPSCCSGTWDATCTAAVQSVCGATCSCRSGEQEYNGSCYYHETDDDDWDDARADCQARGSGWDLVSIANSAENDFITNNVIDNSEAWIGFTDGNGFTVDGEWVWTTGNPSGSFSVSSSMGGGTTTVFDWGDSWSYLAWDWDPGSSWGEYWYNDSWWPSGEAKMGFGNGDEETWFAKNGYTYYFRNEFELTELPSAATLSVLFDDGYVAYVNGVEVAREHVSDTDHDENATSSSSGDEIETGTIDVSPFRIGDNVVAIMVKNRSNGSDDLSFDAKLEATFAPVKAIEYGAQWRYYSAAAEPPSNWSSAAFDDSGWSQGDGQLGFGDGDEATTFSKTGASYYFRRKVTLTQPVTSATLSVLYDDGFIAYVNGTEVMRERISNDWHTAYSTGGWVENETASGAIDTSPFVIGENVIAVVVKNSSSGSSDLSFDLELEVETSAGGMYANFGPGEPDEDEPCAHFEEDRAGTWGDESCNQNLEYVCEGPPKRMEGGTAPPASGPWTAIAAGSQWAYRNQDSDPGDSWANPTYDDSSWSRGAGQLGFGDGDESTSFSQEGASYYFRHVVTIPNEISDAAVNLVYDDAFALFVNGTLVESRNLNDTSHWSYASSSSNDNETLSIAIPVDSFVQGDNTIAVMVKNRSSSNDVSFDMELRVALCEAGGCPDVGAWSATCVDLVESVCAVRCDDSDPPETTGQCVSWRPGDVNSSCDKADLAVGIPCDGVVPVCNHGTQTAPAGVRLIHFPANSGHYPNCDPNQGHPGVEECFTAEEIPPGECVSVTTCPGLTGNREIMVNPPGTSQVDECTCQDNWSLYSNGQCGEPVCDGSSSVATLTSKPVDIIFIIDNSGSMQGEIEQVQQRINEDFATIIEDSGVDYRVIMMSRYGNVYSPVGYTWYPICVSSPLGGHDCSNPISQGVAHNPGKFYHFSTDVGSRNTLCRLIEGWSNSDELASDYRSWTPVAPNGYRELLREEARKAFVVITDDDVDCSWGGYDFDDDNTVSGGQGVAQAFDQALLTISPEHFGTSDDRNYVFHSIVAMAENTDPEEPWQPSQSIQTGRCSPGSEGPGTGYQALSVLTGGLRYPTCRNDDFDAIFQALAEDVVEGAVLSCDLALNANEDADPDKTVVTYTPGNILMSPVVLTRVNDAASCVANSYYYQNETTVTLCPATCATVQADPTGSLGVEVGCAGGNGYAARTLTESYKNECPDDAEVQWAFLTYQTTTPSDSSVVFSIRSATTEEGLAAAAWTPVATAQASPTNTQSCTMAGPNPTCPIDLYTALGGLPNALHPFLELQMTLNPSSDLTEPSSIQQWEVSYSCPDAQ